nr:5-formyltetrahydrofolate cyclo-ligase [Maliibacterium massiliense]
MQREKQALRAKMRQRLRQMDRQERQRQAMAVAAHLRKTGVWQRAACVLLYHALPSEVDTSHLIDAAQKAGKAVLLPVCVSASVMEAARYSARDALSADMRGILAPGGPEIVPPARIDCVIVPGLAFTKEGLRMGRGAGYYDRFLARLSPQAKRIGVCFDQQLVTDLPTEAHDARLDAVVCAMGIFGDAR